MKCRENIQSNFLEFFLSFIDILVDYDEYGDDIPSELNNLADLTRFIKKKTRMYKCLQLHNHRLKKRFAKVVDEYFEYGVDQDIILPDLVSLIIVFFLGRLQKRCSYFVVFS